MQNSAHTDTRSDLPDAAESGVRTVGPDEEDPDREEDDVDYSPEGSFFGESDEAACNRVWGMFARASARHGNAPDLVSSDGHVLSSAVWRRAGAAA